MINKKCIIALAVFYCVLKTIIAQQCSAKSENCSSKLENKYSKDANEKYNKYLNLIEAAKASYQKCENKNCNCYLPVIKKDLKPFKNGISIQMLQDIKTKGTKYQIIDNRIYRDKNCMFPSRCAGIDYFLLQIAHKLPNLELIINCRDWPQINKHYGAFGPIFSFSKTSEYYDIMYPAWAFWEGGPAIGLYPKGIGRWDLHRSKLRKKANETVWEMKKPLGFFRGSRTSGERDPLVLLSRQYPNLVDALFTKNQAWKSVEDTLGAPPASEVSFEDHCNYKYLFNFRGVAASFRFKHILLCKSLVFHVGDEWQEFFYGLLKPWIHYVPMETNASKENIKEILEFFNKHDDLAREIAENGFNIIWEGLRMKDVSCYWSKLLKKYAKLLMFNVERDVALIEISN